MAQKCLSLDEQVKFREFLSTEYGEAQLDFLLEAMKLESLPSGEQDQAATKVGIPHCFSSTMGGGVFYGFLL